MKRLHVTPLLAAMMLSATVGAAFAQTSTVTASGAPMQIKMERSEFMRMFMWDEASEMWVMRANVQPPAGVRSRTEVKSDRDMFLSMNRWDNGTSKWVPVTGAPRNMSTMSREEVKADTANYLRTHRYDEPTGKWTARSTGGSQ